MVRAGIDVSLDDHEDVFIQQVAHYQRCELLDVDGVIGPKTAASMRTESYTEPSARDYVVVAGKACGIEADVVSYNEEGGLAFEQTDPGAWRADELLTMAVVHAKGAEGGALGTWSYLRYKHLGVHFTIERNGRIWQYADPVLTRCAHAGLVNRFSFGIEMTNQMWPLSPNRYDRVDRTERWVHRDPQSTDYGRLVTRKVQGMLDPQLRSAVALLMTVCAAGGVDMEVPIDDTEAYWPGLLPNLMSLSKKKLTGRLVWKTGVIGHLNVTNGHQDPSSDVFERLLAAGFQGRRVR